MPLVMMVMMMLILMLTLLIATMMNPDNALRGGDDVNVDNYGHYADLSHIYWRFRLLYILINLFLSAHPCHFIPNNMEKNHKEKTTQMPNSIEILAPHCCIAHSFRSDRDSNVYNGLTKLP